MHAREQYLASLREDYRRATKKQKTRLLNEARRRTRLNRKVLIRKLAHAASAHAPRKRIRRTATYGAAVVTALVHIWELFDYACGQRLAPAMRPEIARLRAAGELHCSDQVAEQLERISPSTIDRLLGRERQLRRLRRNRRAPVHPLLYKRVPVKVAADWDTSEVGNVQVDYVEHCGETNAGEYLHTLSTVDIASSWWEGEVIASRSQAAAQEAIDRIRKRAPYRFREIHPDNDRGWINQLLWSYCRRRGIRMSRSRPYKKNDNAWVEQRNWTHVRQVVGYRRFDTTAELAVMRELYAALRLYKNFFQPAMKLRSKIRVGGKIRRVYDEAKTPYQRLLDSGQLSAAAEKRLRREYEGLNVAELRRRIEGLRDRLFDLLESKAECSQKPRRGKLMLTIGRADRKRQWLRNRMAGE